jgi:hypothetical protein
MNFYLFHTPKECCSVTVKKSSKFKVLSLPIVTLHLLWENYHNVEKISNNTNDFIIISTHQQQYTLGNMIAHCTIPYILTTWYLTTRTYFFIWKCDLIEGDYYAQ